MKTIKLGVLTLAMSLFGLQGNAFCGFYVAKADAKLFNKKSEVIFVRDGNRSVITMSNDFKGDVKDFAMVVPVPVVLQKQDIRVANPNVFSIFDSYSAPRLVEYYDQNPCYQIVYESNSFSNRTLGLTDVKLKKEVEEDSDGVSIQAKYTVGEYDILILSAKESTGLETWLIRNGYKIPKGAKEVLEPYIKSNMKFFVAKVNLGAKAKSGFNELRPLQISVHTDKFMLPIRLGMANATDNQDLVVYTITKKGRVETTNYRTAKIPTDVNVPTFVKPKFGEFYKDLFKTAWKREGENVVQLEYSWDLSSRNYMKCDPCVGTPPQYTNLREAGVYWINNQRNAGSDYTGDLYFTRMHVRYNRKSFPQDLQFQVTPNKQNFQGRYILQHPVKGSLASCDAETKNTYYKGVAERREKELHTLANLTNWNIADNYNYVDEYAAKVIDENKWFGTDEEENKKKNSVPVIGFKLPGNGSGFGGGMLLFLLGLTAVGWFYIRKRQLV